MNLDRSVRRKMLPSMIFDKISVNVNPIKKLDRGVRCTKALVSSAFRLKKKEPTASKTNTIEDT